MKSCRLRIKLSLCSHTFRNASEVRSSDEKAGVLKSDTAGDLSAGKAQVNGGEVVPKRAQNPNLGLVSGCIMIAYFPMAQINKIVSTNRLNRPGRQKVAKDSRISGRKTSSLIILGKCVRVAAMI